MSCEIKAIWGYARTARRRVTSDMERAGLPANCCLCRTRFIHRSNQKVPHEWHHRNGNPFDNRKRNLVALCSRCHSELHFFAIQTYLLVSWTRLGMHIGNAGATYVSKNGKFFIKSSPERLHRKRPRRFIRLAESLSRWARELAQSASFTKTRCGRYQNRLLMRNLREAIRGAVPSERVQMQRLLTNFRQ
jgi:hypothetical protein